MDLLKRALNRIYGYYLVYELRTSLYILEPWEKALFNGLLVVFLAMSTYTSYLFLPTWTGHFIAYLVRLASPETADGGSATIPNCGGGYDDAGGGYVPPLDGFSGT